MNDTAIHDLLSRQDGLISHAQALAHGVSESTVQRRVRGGAWERLLPRVYLVGGHPPTDASRVRAVGLWVGDDATVSGPAAAWWHGMRATAPAEVIVTVPRRRNPGARSDVQIRRRDLHPVDRMSVRHLWVTDKPLTALETAIAVPDGSVFLDRALQRHVRFSRVYSAYCRNMGSAGSAAAGRLLVAAADRADSAAERLLIELLRGAGITGWVHGLPFGRWVVDLAFPVARLAIEVDGWAWHADAERFRSDRHKGNALVRGRWDLLRFTWHDLTLRPAYVVAEIRAALAVAA
ncbi:MAG: DUF559 domain-containing protein [Pseudonocardia sp.]|nr:DUF559 domain-containing protein [Pseudonocardia sp.]